ncbi:unnamed protein product [Lactuca virosa]|uniref:WHIM1 domain-containing protein n=1 Tax=Lactuca virosa TaxID=75947 RepID=A0AAU9LYK5_9ASTR|nr:unnamed protein product [Lactuca virosa]
MFLDITTALKEKEYWELDADKKTFLLKFLCDELLKTSLIHTNLKEPDVNNRFYWGFPNTNTSTHYGIIITRPECVIPIYYDSDSGAWRLFQSDEQIKNLINSNETTRRETILSHNNGLATKASELLEANMAKWHRCDCLEPVLPCRYHCVKCHETFFINVEFEQHKKNKFDCGLGLVSRPGPSCDSLRQLKMNLLDMEAALPDGAKRGSRASSEWRSEWSASVKSANTVYEMVEATMVLETKIDYINNTW